ncbi:zinc ribbon domain-containing protein [Nitrosococcus halophilus]|uniref:zinc ribbon domain-containing protein n=1 Tax=Nitrosococcus halophilus TaxID=133539 RepID=UPI0012FEF5F3
MVRHWLKRTRLYATQDCHWCGHRQALKLANRLYRCFCCGLEMCRDQNGALNILGLGL